MRAEPQQTAPAAAQPARPAPNTQTELRDQIREAVRAAQEGARDGRQTRVELQGTQVTQAQAPPAPPAAPGAIVINGKTISMPQGLPRVNVDPDGRMTVVGSDGRTTIREPDGRVVMIAADGSISQASGVPSAHEFIAPVQIPEEVLITGMSLLAIVLCVIGFPIARAIARRMDRKTVAAPAMMNASLPPEAASRLERIEQSVDAIAIEVERISEGQRFTTRLMSQLRGAAAQQPHHAPAAAHALQLPPASLNETSFAQRAMARPDVATPASDAQGTGGRLSE